MESALRSRLPGGRFTDVSAARSQHMSSVRGRGNRTTERRLQLGLVRAGVSGWSMNVLTLKGKPDFVFASERLVIFVDGCFWHGCPRCGHVPTRNSAYWSEKLRRNKVRDENTTKILLKERYRVLRFWEHELKDDLAKCVTRITSRLDRTAK